jgi:8-oxo-dGTP diphosphatase
LQENGAARRVDVALAIPVRAERVLVTRRGADQHLPGAWEFPGGKVQADEDPAAAAARELHEETGLVAGPLEPLALFVHEYPDRAVRLHVFLARAAAGEVRLDGSREWAWRTLSELHDLDMPAANGTIVRALAWRLAPGRS